MATPPPCPPPPPGCPPPPALPALISSPAGAVAGSLYVVGSDLRYIANDAKEYGGTGPSIATPGGAIKGSAFLGGDGVIHYIDASGVERGLQSTSLGAKAGGSLTGSTWVETGQVVAKQLVVLNSVNKVQWWNGF